MTPMDYSDSGWIPPWREGLPQARCVGKNCSPEGVPGRLVVAITLDKDGLCRPCAQTADDSHTWMRLGVENT